MLKRRYIIIGFTIFILSLLPHGISFAAEMDGDLEITEETTGYNINGISMTEEEYQSFISKLDTCKSKEDYYNLYQSMGMDTSELDKVYANINDEESSDDSSEDTSNISESNDDDDEVCYETPQDETEVIEDKSENEKLDKKNIIEQSDKGDSDEFSYQYDNTKAIIIIKIVVLLMATITVGIVIYLIKHKKNNR